MLTSVSESKSCCWIMTYQIFSSSPWVDYEEYKRILLHWIGDAAKEVARFRASFCLNKEWRFSKFAQLHSCNYLFYTTKYFHISYISWVIKERIFFLLSVTLIHAYYQLHAPHCHVHHLFQILEHFLILSTVYRPW